MNTVLAVPFFTDDTAIQVVAVSSFTTSASQANNAISIARLSWVFEQPVSVAELKTATGYQHANLYQTSNGHLEIRLRNPGTGHGISLTGPAVERATKNRQADPGSPEENNHDAHVRPSNLQYAGQ